LSVIGEVSLDKYKEMVKPRFTRSPDEVGRRRSSFVDSSGGLCMPTDALTECTSRVLIEIIEEKRRAAQTR